MPGFEFFRHYAGDSNNSYKLALSYQAGTGRYTMPLGAIQKKILQTMKPLAFLTILMFCLSCSVPRYMFQNPEQSTGLDFTSGLWLINEVDAPGTYQAQITELAKKDFTENLGERVDYIYDKQGLLLPNKIPLQLTSEELENIKKGSGYDYLINIQAAKLSNEQLSITPGGQNY